MTDPAPTPHAPVPEPAGTPAGWYNDAASMRKRWWDGTKWTENFGGPAAVVVAKNGAATAALILGICGFVLMAIPFFIGWFLGGIPDILAVIFGIIGLVKANAALGTGRAAAIVGLVLGIVSLLTVFIGAGSIW